MVPREEASEEWKRSGERPTASVLPPAGAANDDELPYDEEPPLVLVVDDDGLVRSALVRILGARYRVATAVNGRDGLAKAKQLKPDLVLTDVEMPEMSGPELVSAVRRQPELDSTPIVVLTGNRNHGAKAELLLAGAQDYLEKPVSHPELRARVGNLIAKKRNTDRLRRAEANFRGIVALSVDAIISVDENQRIVLYNEGAEQMFGWSRGEALGQQVDMLLPERFRDAHRTHVPGFALGAVHARRMGEDRPEVLGRRKNGEEFPALASISKLDVEGKSRLSVMLRDISELERAAREQRFLAEAGELLAATLDEEQTIAAVTRLAVRELADFCVLNLSSGEGPATRRAALARNPANDAACEALELLRHGPSRAPLASAVLEAGEPVLMTEVELEDFEAGLPSEAALALLRSGELRSAIAMPLISRGVALGSLVLGRSRRTYGQKDLPLVEEFARRVALSLDSARLYQTARRAVDARDAVLGVVAHDLRNPLNNILLHLRELRRPEDAPERRNLGPLRAIARNADHMSRLIEDLLDVTRIDAGRLSLRPGRVVTDELVLEAVERQRPLLSSAGLELELELPADLPQIDADRDRVVAVFSNLIGNAVKFSARGGRITVGAQALDGETLFWVADSGRGIPEHELPHVFDRFWQAQGDQRGAGLGLSIVKGIVEAHGGQVWAANLPDGGAKLSFSLRHADGAAPSDPSILVSASRPLETEAARPRNGGSPALGRLLVVDDDADSCEALATLLGEEGYAVETAQTGQQGLAVLATFGPDLVIVDQRMPGMNGVEFMRRLRLGDPSPRCILVTGYDPSLARPDALGAAGFVPKPIDFESLLRTVETLLRAEPRCSS